MQTLNPRLISTSIQYANSTSFWRRINVAPRRRFSVDFRSSLKVESTSKYRRWFHACISTLIQFANSVPFSTSMLSLNLVITLFLCVLGHGGPCPQHTKITLWQRWPHPYKVWLAVPPPLKCSVKYMYNVNARNFVNSLYLAFSCWGWYHESDFVLVTSAYNQ